MVSDKITQIIRSCVRISHYVAITLRISETLLEICFYLRHGIFKEVPLSQHGW